jgi:hypothetical protein
MSAIDIARGLTQLRPDWNIDGPYQFGEIGAVGAHGANTVDVYLDGSTSLTTGLHYLADYGPQVNDPVMVARLQGSSQSARVVIGRLAATTSAWQPIPTYTNSWASGAGPASSATAAGYRIQGDRVWLAGYIQSGTTGHAAFTLPTGARPTVTVYPTSSVSVSPVANCNWNITPAGVATPYFSSGSTPALDGLTFTVD